MTSLSRFSAQGRRSLAVYQTPPVPEGWHGRDLVRIMDPVGLATAWLSPFHAAAIVGFSVRSTPDSPWTSLIQASIDPETAPIFVTTEPEANLPIWCTLPDWSMTRRDPTSLTVSDAANTLTIDSVCALGALQIVASWTAVSPPPLDYRIGLDAAGDQIDVSQTRSDHSIELLLSRTGEDIGID